MRANVVGEDQGVAAVLMGVEEVDAFHLHDACGEAEVGLAVLDHVVPGAVAAGKFVVDAESVRSEDLFDDVRDLLELEYLEVRAPRGVP